MTPVVPFSVSNAALVPGIPFVSRKTNCLTRRNSLRKTTTKKFALKKNFVPLSALVGTFHGYKTVLSVPGLRMHTLAASGTEVAVQESDPATVGEDASDISEVEPSALETSETPSLSAQANDTPNIKSKRSRPVRKSEMPPVKNEDLVPGATFMGKVRSIQPFGAFVDFGAFTDGLVHVSRLSNSFVKDVGSVVSIGQEVKVKLVEVSTETGRISLSMRESDDTGKLQQRKDAAASGDKPRTTRRNGTKSNQKSSKFVKGQDLQGTVKSLNRAGAFIALPEGEEGFLPTSEESEEGLADMMGGSMLQVGQEVGVKVLRITRGQVTLTMKKEENDEMLNSSQGVVHAATNPFLLAFRKNKEIAAFLDERDKVLNSAKTAVTSKTSGDLEGKVNQTEMEIAIPEVPDQPKSSEEDLVTVSSASDKVVEDVKTFSGDEENRLEAASVILDAPSVVPESGNEKTEGAVSSSLHSFDASKEAMLEEEVVPEMVTPEASVPSESQIPEDASITDVLKDDGKSDPAGEMSGDQILSSEIVDGKKFAVSQVDVALASGEEQVQAPLIVENNVSSAMLNDHEKEVIKSQPEASVPPESQIPADASETDVLKDDGKSDPAGELSVDQILSSESVDSKKFAESQVNVALVSDEEQVQAPLIVENNVSAISNEHEKEVTKSQPDNVPANDELDIQEPPNVVNEVLPATSNEDEKEDQILSSESVDSKKFAESQVNVALVSDEEQVQAPLIVENNVSSAMSNEHEKEVTKSQPDNVPTNDELEIQEPPNVVNEVLPATSDEDEKEDQILSSESVDSKKFAESQVNVALVRDEEQAQAPLIVENNVSSAMSNEHEKEGQPDNIPAYDELEIQEPPNVVNEVIPATSNEDEKEVVKSPKKHEVQTETQLTMENEVILATSGKDEEEVRENQADGLSIDQVPTQASLTMGDEVSSATSSEPETLPSTPEKNGNVINSNGQADGSPQPNSTKATVSPALVKQLREETGAGMMDCKNALSETGGDIVKAQEHLRKKGLASADKKASRVTAEGRIGSYIHDSRIGVLIEVNCETDFVSRGDIFKDLIDDLAMQVAACPQVQYINVDDVPEEIVNKEREIEMQKEDLLSKPEQIRSKIVEGRISKRLGELALLEQPYIKNDKLVVKDWVKQTIATIGENVKVNRFVRYNLGEGLEKKSQDFAAEVAAQTAAKPFPAAPGKDKSTTTEAKESVEKPPTVTVSAALVKQLREETGAGMMDCKRALAETGGNLEKAQEYLRKKGLSSADKKSSRLAAEGRIGSYIHDSRIGVLIEVNCETDFVGRSEKFKELVEDLAMQVVACPQVQFVSIEDIPESMVNKEKELEMQREDLLSKPENIREKIVEGRVSKRLGEVALLEQPFIKNDGLLVKDLVKQTVASLGENIKVRRFVRFTLGDASKNGQTAT